MALILSVGLGLGRKLAGARIVLGELLRSHTRHACLRKPAHVFRSSRRDAGKPSRLQGCRTAGPCNRFGYASPIVVSHAGRDRPAKNEDGHLMIWGVSTLYND